MGISMCACGSPACKHCNPNIWTGVPENTHGPNPFTQRIVELEAENAKLHRKLDAVEHRLAEYMATNDSVAVSYAVQLRRIMHEALLEDK